MKWYAKIVILIVIILSSFFALAQEEWKLAKDKNDIKIYTKPTEDSKFKSYKGEAIVKVNIEELYNKLLDVDNASDWIYECTESYQVTRISDSNLIYYAAMKTPWPFSNRDMVTEIQAYTVQTENKVVIEYFPVEDVVEAKEKIVRIVDHHEKTTLYPLEENVTRITMEGYVDPGGNLPAWLVNMFIADGPYESILTLKSLLE
jgi:hypothetical protein